MQPTDEKKQVNPGLNSPGQPHSSHISWYPLPTHRHTTSLPSPPPPRPRPTRRRSPVHRPTSSTSGRRIQAAATPTTRPTRRRSPIHRPPSSTSWRRIQAAAAPSTPPHPPAIPRPPATFQHELAANPGHGDPHHPAPPPAPHPSHGAPALPRRRSQAAVLPSCPAADASRVDHHTAAPDLLAHSLLLPSLTSSRPPPLPTAATAGRPDHQNSDRRRTLSMATAPPQLRSASSPSASSPSQPRASYFPVRCGDEDMVHCGARLPVPSCRGGVLASSPDPARAHLPLNHSIKVLALRQATPFQRARRVVRAILACSVGELGVQCGRAWRAVYGPFPSSIQRTPCHPLHSCAV